MQEDMQRNRQQYDDDEIVLDLSGILDDYLRCIKKYWMQFILVIVMTTGVLTAFLNLKYEPSYLAKITYAVMKTGDTGIDASVAKRLSGAIPVLSKNAKFQESLFQGMDEETLNRNFSLSASFTEGANLFSITVNTNNYKNANLILDAFEQIYPDWADRSSGALKLQVVDKSQATEEPVNSYSLVKNLIMGILAGMALCFVYGTYYVLSIKTVRKESDMRKITTRNCIGLIPEIQVKKRAKSKKEQLILTNKRLDWGFKQSMLAAQARIQKHMDQKNNKVLLVTSTLPEEGKSILAANLALAFGELEKKILLIDGDIRKPSIGKLLGIQESQGLTEYLQKSSEIEKFLVPCGKIFLLQAGQKRGHVSAVLDEQKMEKMMSELRQMFDYIIIDTPPAYLFSDASLLAQYADSVVYMVRHDMAEIREIKKGMATFQNMKNLMGYLINRSQGGFSTYGKYGYGKYGKYGKYSNYSKYKRYMKLDEDAMNTEESLNSDEEML